MLLRRESNLQARARRAPPYLGRYNNARAAIATCAISALTQQPINRLLACCGAEVKLDNVTLLVLKY